MRIAGLFFAASIARATCGNVIGTAEMRLCFLIGAAAAFAAVRPASATVLLSGESVPAAVELARMACDEFGRCWDQPVRAYRRNYGDDYGGGYSYGESYWGHGRPPTKWERKGFCPPGQAKKGNC